MAVNFKVPASPKRNISASDTFIGVDLTNTAVDMEGSRSPNAENMVRHVPGKVRKRMGYYKEILFGKEVNVNFADGTSSKEKEITVSTVDTWIKVYDTIQPLASKDESAFTLYFEFDYKADDDFKFMNDSTTISGVEEWTHYSGSIEYAADASVSEIQVKSATQQEIYIKNFAVMRSKNESYEWSPAPRVFIERETNDPIYGCHYLSNSQESYEGDRVVNVNRALRSFFIEKHLYANTWTKIADLVETPCLGTKVHVKLTYSPQSVTSDVKIAIYDNAHEAYVYNMGTTFSVIDYEFTIDSYLLKPEVMLYSADAADVHVEELAVMYEYDATTYSWRMTPEEQDETFPIDDIYSIDSVNHSEITEYETEIYDTTGTASFIVSEATDVKGYAYVSFDLVLSNLDGDDDDEITHIAVSITSSTSTGSVLLRSYDPELRKIHFNAAVPLGASDATISSIRVTITQTYGTRHYARFTDVRVSKVFPKTSYFVSPKNYIYHVGSDFYFTAHGSNSCEKIYSGANRHISKSYQLNNALYIIDGKEIYKYSINEGEHIDTINQDMAYIPLITYAKKPSGGGTSYDALNLIQPGFYEQFIGEANVTEYCLSFRGLDATKCKAWIKDSDGKWIEKVEGTHFTVNRYSGIVTFTTAPGAPHVTGEDNVKILAYRTVPGYRERITKCTFGALFGVNGAGDRLFLSGNPEHPNWDFHSGLYDATYFPDLGYSVLGSEQSKIMGYAIVNNYLTTFKDGFDMSQSVFVREGDLLKDEEKNTSDAVFKLINTLQGEGALSPYTFGYLQTEPLFLTKAGIYAITEQDITGEKYTQNRSFYLDGKLRKEPNLENAIATIYDNQYVLAVNNQLYILDGLQATRTDKSEPYATRQYAGFHCKDIPATYIWTDDALCFGTADGKVCRFYTDEEALASYNDDGKPIYACWETPDLDGQLFYKNKTFRYFAVRLMKAIKTSVRLYSKKLGIWTLNDEEAWTFIKEQTAIANALNFESVDFDMFTFSVDTSEKVVHTKLRVKKVDKARFRVENDALNEPFGISDIALEYIESGNYKG